MLAKHLIMIEILFFFRGGALLRKEVDSDGNQEKEEGRPPMSFKQRNPDIGESPGRDTLFLHILYLCVALHQSVCYLLK